MPDSAESAGSGGIRPEGGAEDGKSFPTNAVVGVIDAPRSALAAARDLRRAGFETDLLCSARGLERIEAAGGSADDVRVTRMVQSLFGYEADHTERHVEELEKGGYLLVVDSGDDLAADRIRDIFAEHSGHFVNYYSRWTGRTLLP